MMAEFNFKKKQTNKKKQVEQMWQIYMMGNKGVHYTMITFLFRHFG